MTVPLQQETTLSCSASRVQAGDRLILRAEHTVLAVDRQTTFVVDEDGPDRAERDERPLRERRASGLLIR